MGYGNDSLIYCSMIKTFILLLKIVDAILIQNFFLNRFYLFFQNFLITMFRSFAIVS